MRRQAYVDAITDRFALLASKLRLNNSANLTDINVHLEDPLCRILNLLKGWHLVDQNIFRSNEPGIDLADVESGVCVQITSRVTSKKVKKTLRVFFDQKYDEKYRELYIVFISDDPLKPGFLKTCASYVEKGFPFKPKEHIWNLQSLTRLIMMADLEVIKKIMDILDDAMGPILRGSGSDCDFLPLPLPALEFIPKSRDDDIAKIHQAMQHNEPIYVTGPGGIGKTELVLKMAWNIPGNKKVYYMKYTSAPRAGETFMRTTVLEAIIDGNPFTDNDPVLRNREYIRRIQQIKQRMNQAVLILDGFNLPGKNPNTLRNDPDFRALNRMGAQLIITTCYALPYYTCRVEPLDEQLLQRHIFSCCENVQENDAHISRLIQLFDRNTMMIHLLIYAINYARMSPEQILAIQMTDASAAAVSYTPHLFLQNMCLQYEHEDTTPEQRTNILAFFEAVQEFLNIGDPLRDWYHRQTIAEGGL